MSTIGIAVILSILWSGCGSSVLKREVDLLDMLRTPLMLSFNRNNAFVSQERGSRERELIPRLLGIPRAQRLRETTME
ncbi:hypothetical protein RB195_002772 [Necator americanus]|uniref:Uncharacterized protein n=2 Tax=Necator americanus TaxID=51031 RepID=W2TXD8_NECAM|nr:hypothetical protein NECAME_16291 [Necator americanus]ETN86508.1 hypothetical protein NECAME_16291 [Necator americanus]